MLRLGWPASFALGLIALWSGDGADAASAADVVPVSIARPGSYWVDRGFVEMTPPIRLPSRDGKERIAIWLHVPDGERIDVARARDGRPALTYPPGTVADRVDMRDGDDPASVEDVRGTFFGVGDERFHVLRPLGGEGLTGVEWPRGSTDAGRRATETMVARLAASAPPVHDRALDRMLSKFAAQNDCAFCHEHDKHERRWFGRVASEDEPPPNRGTDSGGLYTIESVLGDEAPIETHRPRDMNEGDPYVSAACADGTPATFWIGRGGEERRFRCVDGSVPRARLDVPGAMAAGDAHARAVCSSRAYLWRHSSEDVHHAFAAAFAECRIGS